MSDYNTRQTLIGRIVQQQDDKSWQDFVYFYQRFIYTVACRMGVNHHDTEDLVQRVLLVLWKKMPDFQYDPARCKFRTWVSNITRKEVMNYFRTQTNYKRRLEKAGVEEALKSPVEVLDKIAEDEWKLHISNLAWGNIKGEFRGNAVECFQLCNEGLKAEEIGERLGIAASSVYVLKKRIVDRLCREIRRLDDELN